MKDEIKLILDEVEKINKLGLTFIELEKLYNQTPPEDKITRQAISLAVICRDDRLD